MTARADLVRQTFGGLGDEFYPGSTQRRRESLEAKSERMTMERRQAREDEPWDAHPKEVEIKIPTKSGVRTVRVEVFPIGALAKALKREPVTIRSWILKGWIPKARFKTPPIHGTRGNAGRRLWTRRQIEGMLQIAQEEGLLDEKGTQMQKTNFSKRVFAAHKEWLP
jgi:hypothetical protein